MAPKKHACRWRSAAERLEAEFSEQKAAHATMLERLNALEHKMAPATKQIVGPKSERMLTPEEEAKKREGKTGRSGGYTNPKKRKEKEKAEALALLPTTIVNNAVPDDERRYTHCGEDIKPIGQGDRSVEYEWVPGHLERRVHVVEVGRCPCKMHYARCPARRRVQEGCTYGPAFLAKLAVDKCADSTPIYRVEKQMRRKGIPISRSTLNDNVLLAAADVLFALWQYAHDVMRSDPHVQADETSFLMQTRAGRVFVWRFLSKLCTAYVFSPSRSGDTAKDVLVSTKGALTIDRYTGYHTMTDVDGRERTGCWSHARRYLFDALASAPEARDGLDIILDLFLVEREAQSLGIVGTAEPLSLSERRRARRCSCASVRGIGR